MEEARYGRLFKYLVYAAFIITVVITVVLDLSSMRLFFYPAVAVAVALFVSALLLTFEFSVPGPDIQVDTRVLDIILLVLIVMLALSTGPRRDFSTGYFLVVILTSMLLAYRISSVTGYRNLFFVLLLGTVLRANIWFSAPHFSRDPRLHVAITGFIRETGRMVPRPVDDYHDYPIADILSGITSILTGADGKHAVFLSLSLAGILGAAFVYLFVRKLFEEEAETMAAYAAFFFSMSAFNFVLTAGPKPQTLSATLFVVAIFASQLGSKLKRTLLIFFVGAVMIFTHVLAPLVLAAVLLFYYLTSVTVRELKARYGRPAPYVRHTTALSLGLITLVMILQQYHEVGHFRIQFLRVFGAFIPSRGGAQSFATGSTRVTTTEILLGLDHIFLQAGDFLLAGLLIGITGVTFLYYRVFHARREVVPDRWVIASFLMYAGFSIVFFAQATQARRAAVALLAVSAPAIIYSLYWFHQRWDIVGRAVVVGLLVSSVYLGIANPGVYLIERSSGFVPVLYASEVAMLQHFNDHATPAIRDGRIQGYSDSYTRTSGYMEWVEGGHETDRAVYYTEHIRGIDEHRMSGRAVADVTAGGNDSVFLYRSYYAGFSDAKPPPTSETIYTSGDAMILR